MKIVYNNADEVVAWMADDYLDLNREQEDGLRLLLARFHAWHRSTQLREYARLLDAAEMRLAEGLTDADVDWAVDAVASRYRILANHGAAAHQEVEHFHLHLFGGRDLGPMLYRRGG